jgi:hypothetical protein
VALGVHQPAGGDHAGGSAAREVGCVVDACRDRALIIVDEQASEGGDEPPPPVPGRRGLVEAGNGVVLVGEDKEVADPALGQQRNCLLGVDRGPEAGVAVRRDKAGHQQRISQTAGGGNVGRAGGPGRAL